MDAEPNDHTSTPASQQQDTIANSPNEADAVSVVHASKVRDTDEVLSNEAPINDDSDSHSENESPDVVYGDDISNTTSTGEEELPRESASEDSLDQSEIVDDSNVPDAVPRTDVEPQEFASSEQNEDVREPHEGAASPESPASDVVETGSTDQDEDLKVEETAVANDEQDEGNNTTQSNAAAARAEHPASDVVETESDTHEDSTAATTEPSAPIETMIASPDWWLSKTYSGEYNKAEVTVLVEDSVCLLACRAAPDICR